MAKLHEECGVFGVWNPDGGCANTVYYGLVALQHRGQEGCENVQPLVLRYVKGTLAIAHNGNITNTAELKKELEKTGAIFQTTADTEIIAYLIARERVNSPSIEEAVKKVMGRVKGAFSLLVMSPNKLIAARDPWGFRPLCIGKKGKINICAA